MFENVVRKPSSFTSNKKHVIKNKTFSWIALNVLKTSTMLKETAVGINE